MLIYYDNEDMYEARSTSQNETRLVKIFQKLDYRWQLHNAACPEWGGFSPNHEKDGIATI